MSYSFNFAVVLQYWPELLRGVLLTLSLTGKVLFCGLLIGLLGALVHLYSGRVGRTLITAWVEFTRNTPMLVQLFLIYFGLPQLGLRLDANLSAVIGLSFYLGAFATEIFRAGIGSIPQGHIEAGYALGLRPLQVFRYVIMVPALYAIAPAIAAQSVIILLATSVVSSISADELTSIANGLQTKTFKPFEFYIAASLLYLTMAMAIRAILSQLVNRFLSAGHGGRA